MNSLEDLMALRRTQAAPAKPCSEVGHVYGFAGQGAAMISVCVKCGRPRDLETRATKTEKRFAPDGLEHRFMLSDLVVTSEDGRQLEGYGCRYGVRDSYDTIFEPGCFAESLSEWRSKGMWPSFYLQHDWDLIVGGWNDMYEDRSGLFVKGDFLQSAWGEHARALVKEKRARGLSIGFIAIEWEIREADDGVFVRHVKKALLFEVSLVEREAVPGSKVTAVRGWQAEAEQAKAERQAAQAAEAAEAQAAETRAAVNRDLISMFENAASQLKS